MMRHRRGRFPVPVASLASATNQKMATYELYDWSKIFTDDCCTLGALLVSDNMVSGSYIAQLSCLHEIL
jgi:hypothetical protein